MRPKVVDGLVANRSNQPPHRVVDASAFEPACIQSQEALLDEVLESRRTAGQPRGIQAEFFVVFFEEDHDLPLSGIHSSTGIDEWRAFFVSAPGERPMDTRGSSPVQGTRRSQNDDSECCGAPSASPEML